MLLDFRAAFVQTVACYCRQLSLLKLIIRCLSQLADVARFCNRYPNIAVSFAAAGPDGVGSESPVVSVGDAVTVSVSLAREGTESLDGAGFGIVYAPLYPKVKTENWWLVVGDARANTCLTIKRITLEQSLSVSMLVLSLLVLLQVTACCCVTGEA